MPHTYMHLHADTCKHVQNCKHTHTRAHMQTHMNTHMHAHMHAPKCTHMQRPLRVHTHTHIYAQECLHMSNPTLKPTHVCAVAACVLTHVHAGGRQTATCTHALTDVLQAHAGTTTPVHVHCCTRAAHIGQQVIHGCVPLLIHMRACARTCSYPVTPDAQAGLGSPGDSHNLPKAPTDTDPDTSTHNLYRTVQRHMHVCANAHMHRHRYKCACAHPCKHGHAYLHTHIHACLHRHGHKHPTCTHMHTPTHMCIHTPACVHFPPTQGSSPQTAPGFWQGLVPCPHPHRSPQGAHTCLPTSHVPRVVLQAHPSARG